MNPLIAFVLPSFAGGGAGPLAELLPSDVPLTDLARPRLRPAMPALIGAIRRARPRAVVSSLGYVNLALLAGRRLLPATILFRQGLLLRQPRCLAPWSSSRPSHRSGRAGSSIADPPDLVEPVRAAEPRSGARSLSR